MSSAKMRETLRFVNSGLLKMSFWLRALDRAVDGLSQADSLYAWRATGEERSPWLSGERGKMVRREVRSCSKCGKENSQ